MIEKTYQHQTYTIDISDSQDMQSVCWHKDGSAHPIDITDLVETFNLWDAFESIATGEPVSSIHARRQSEIETNQAKEIIELREQLRAALQRRIVA